jgi:hypothetical protein
MKERERWGQMEERRNKCKDKEEMERSRKGGGDRQETKI